MLAPSLVERRVVGGVVRPDAVSVLGVVEVVEVDVVVSSGLMSVVIGGLVLVTVSVPDAVVVDVVPRPETVGSG